jgi:hypothetical protein
LGRDGPKPPSLLYLAEGLVARTGRFRTSSTTSDRHFNQSVVASQARSTGYLLF